MNIVPEKLNWVEVRANCTIAKVFNQICDGIRDDVAAINSALDFRDDDQFTAEMHSSGTTIIVGQPNKVPRARVYVGIVEQRILVRREWDGNEWSVSIGLNDQGRCILRIKVGLKERTEGLEQELEQWQFRKKALEGLFFGD
jgi:hypothetical protein